MLGSCRIVKGMPYSTRQHFIKVTDIDAGLARSAISLVTTSLVNTGHIISTINRGTKDIKLGDKIINQISNERKIRSELFKKGRV